VVGGPWQGPTGPFPTVSITHTDALAVALAGLSPAAAYIGVDAERLRARPDGFSELAFTEDERALLALVPSEARDEWLLRWWCTKEAVAKGVGLGLVDGPRSVVITGMDVGTELVWARVNGRLAAALPGLTQPLRVHTSRHEDLIVAATLCETEIGSHQYGDYTATGAGRHP
jgi:phosphopantetheinyl transferase (holo-ACP synthase)